MATDPSPLEIDTHARLEKLARWRSVFAGWLLGTRATTDHETAYHRDLREAILLLRAETSAHARLLAELGISHDRWLQVLGEEATALDESLERRFPGYRTTALGVAMTAEARDTARRMRFPA